jgi:HEAT repeat protein
MGFEGLIYDLKKGVGLVRVKAASELGKLKDKKAATALKEALADSNMGVRSNAAFALGELGSKEAVPQLIRLLNDPEERVRKSAAKALGMIGTSEAVAPLIQALNHDASLIVRKSAIRSLDQISGPQAIKAVERAASDPDIIIANMAKKALENHQKK